MRLCTPVFGAEAVVSFCGFIELGGVGKWCGLCSWAAGWTTQSRSAINNMLRFFTTRLRKAIFRHCISGGHTVAAHNLELDIFPAGSLRFAQMP